jgi:hypothetical protein
MSRTHVAPGVASVEADGILYAALLPDGPLLSLDGGAAIIWQELQADGDLTTLERRVAVMLTDAPTDLGAQIQAFVETMLSHGLLTAPTG